MWSSLAKRVSCSSNETRTDSLFGDVSILGGEEDGC